MYIVDIYLCFDVLSKKIKVLISWYISDYEFD